MKKIKFKAILIFLCLSVVLCSFSACQKEEPKLEYNYWHLGTYELVAYNYEDVGFEPHPGWATEYKGEIKGDGEISEILREFIYTFLGESLRVEEETIYFKSKPCPYGKLFEWSITDTWSYVVFDNEPAKTLRIDDSTKIHRHFPDYGNRRNYIDYYYITIKTIPHRIENVTNDQVFYFEYRKPINANMG